MNNNQILMDIQIKLNNCLEIDDQYTKLSVIDLLMNYFDISFSIKVDNINDPLQLAYNKSTKLFFEKWVLEFVKPNNRNKTLLLLYDCLEQIPYKKNEI